MPPGRPNGDTAHAAGTMSAMDTLALTPDDLLTTTRSVRMRLDLTRPVPLELVRECLEIALQGATSIRNETARRVRNGESPSRGETEQPTRAQT